MASKPAKQPERRASARTGRFKDIADELTSDSGASRLVASELSGSLGFLIRLANGVVQEQLAQRLGAFDLRPTLYSLLLIIKDNPGLKQQEVGQILSIQQPNLVALINELVSRNLVSRLTNAGDRRSYALTLTPDGEELLAQARRAHQLNERKIADAVKPLSTDEFQAALLRIIGSTR